MYQDWLPSPPSGHLSPTSLCTQVCLLLYIAEPHPIVNQHIQEPATFDQNRSCNGHPKPSGHTQEADSPPVDSTILTGRESECFLEQEDAMRKHRIINEHVKLRKDISFTITLQFDL